MISLVDRPGCGPRGAGAQQRRLPLWHKRLAEIIDLAKNLDDPIQHHRLRHSAMAVYLKKPFSHNPLVARKPLIRVKYIWVSPTGSNSNSGSASAPMKTIQAAVDKASPGTEMSRSMLQMGGRC